MTENRGAQRRRVFKDGVIQSEGVGMKCTVRNISDTGALIVAAQETADQFTLVIVSESLIRKCKVVWRDQNRMGVAFA